MKSKRPKRRKPAKARSRPEGQRDEEPQPAKPKGEIEAKDLQGLKFFKRVQPLLARLHDIGTQRDRAGNRDLHMDEYCVLVLMWLFNPILSSLRGLQQATQLEEVRRKFGVGRASLGSLSESVSIFDPEPLKEIAEQLAIQVPHSASSRFDVVGQQLTAVDGSIFNTAVRVARLAWVPKGKGGQVSAYRLHTQFEVLRGLPTRIDTTPANPKGSNDERVVLADSLEADHCYIIDRGYAKFELFNKTVLGQTLLFVFSPLWRGRCWHRGNRAPSPEGIGRAGPGKTLKLGVLHPRSLPTVSAPP